MLDFELQLDRELSYSDPKIICFVMPVILLQTAILGSFSVSILGAKFVLQNAFPTTVKASYGVLYREISIG